MYPLRAVSVEEKLQLQNLLLKIDLFFSQNANYLVKTAFFFLCRDLAFSPHVHLNYGGMPADHKHEGDNCNILFLELPGLLYFLFHWYFNFLFFLNLLVDFPLLSEVFHRKLVSD